MRENPKNQFVPDDPKTLWLSTGKAPDRDMTVIDEFTYWDPKGKPWIAPAGTEIDGASIPRPLWAIVGSPYTGHYRRASILHDYACEKAKNFAERRAADRMYYYACRKGGCSKAQAVVQYLGVSIGAWAGRIEPLEIYSRPYDPDGETRLERETRQITDEIIVGTFHELWLAVRDMADDADDESVFDKIEDEVDRQLALKAKQLS